MAMAALRIMRIKTNFAPTCIESQNYQLRKIMKDRGRFPNDNAVVNLLWLSICSIEDKRARDRAKERGLPPDRSLRPKAGSSKGLRECALSF